jgi:hypothetical protein
VLDAVRRLIPLHQSQQMLSLMSFNCRQSLLSKFHSVDFAPWIGILDSHKVFATGVILACFCP